jgi:UDP-glucose 4-epimerase
MAGVLVTGGAGFIGSHLVEELLRRGDAVRVLDNFTSGRRENLSGLQGNLEVMEGDLRDARTVEAAVRGVEFVFHQGAFVSVPESLRDPETCFAVNVGGTVTLLEAARRAGVRKVVLASSAAVYGDPEVFPTSEETPLIPLSPYAVSKQVNELYARLYTQAFDLPVVSLRYFNIYGPRQQPDSPYAAAIPIFLNRMMDGQPLIIHGSGKQTRDFIYVRDVVRANLLAAEGDAAGQEFNICTGHETSMLDLLEELNEAASHPFEAHFAPPRPGDVFRSLGSPERAAKILNFRAGTSLAEGLKETIAWLRK